MECSGAAAENTLVPVSMRWARHDANTTLFLMPTYLWQLVLDAYLPLATCS